VNTSLACEECGIPLADHEIYGKEEPPTEEELDGRTVYRYEGTVWPGVFCPQD
jgi:hypothetical protein